LIDIVSVNAGRIENKLAQINSVVETIWREKVVYTPYGSLEEEAQS
jgi:hypothetical protein